MTPARKSIPNILERALKKCERYYYDGVVAYCTPAEFVVLCWYFDTKPKFMWMYEDMVKKGICNPVHRYFHVKKWDREFPVSKHALLGTKIDLEYY